MKYQIEHLNVLNYEAPVDQSLNQIRLKPRTDECQRLLTYRPEITPVSLTKEFSDLWGNNVESFFIAEPHKELIVKSTSVVSIQKSPFIRMVQFSDEMDKIFKSDLFHNHYLSFLNDTDSTFLTKQQMDEANAEIGEESNPVEYMLKVMNYMYEKFTYDPDATVVNTRATEAFDLKRGVCQDLTHVMLGLLRAKGIPSRYVSGYLYVGENSALVGDSATHAWVECMVPGIGWTGLDPTNNVEALEQHIRVGIGRDYQDVSPLQGVYRGGKHTLDVKVSVTLLEQN
ncbi:transglutaminase family protein [Paenalkalicoccus suaedae]|uniref:Transglutaminase family protein n=1 Tax=Paenalkalicoccus suaedae TaxID=2592382 RepID=A0A859FIV7_9BACI|nr:transglutaminase family protein [Paenalkalicoccus suaedae]QKS72880.1 transglutaminase family protein [Paenalkalicoccus suaedae]